MSNLLNDTEWLKHIESLVVTSNIAPIHEALRLIESINPGGNTALFTQTLARATAETILRLKFSSDVAATGLLTPYLGAIDHHIEKTKSKTITINDNVWKLLQGIKRFQSINIPVRQQRDEETLDKCRRMLLAMAPDLRVVIIKLAERLNYLKLLKHEQHEQELKRKVATEVLDWYAPLANRLGIGQLKWELEDLAFFYLEPDTYKTIAKQLAKRRLDREDHIQKQISVINEKLHAQHINAKIAGRAKHIYSIYQKMKRKKTGIEAIYDCSAIRILVNTINDCYTTLGIINTLWQPIPEEFDDYIASPKANGYRSIHTAVVDDDNQQLEVQIRTYDMHEEAELGVAAHWMYKEKRAHAHEEQNKIQYLRQLLAWHSEITENKEIARQGKQKEFVYAITPNGDILELAQSATPLDFAYHVHSDLGHRCRGAKINGQIVPLTYQLRSGDTVEILTQNALHPSRDWLNPLLGYLNTARARSKVRAWFKQALLEESHEADSKIVKQIVRPIKKSTPANAPKKELIYKKPDDLLTRIAKCCKPIPGDETIGYITLGRGISLHKVDCPNVKNIAAKDRIIDIQLHAEHIAAFPVELNITAYDTKNVLNEITSLLKTENVPIISLVSRNNHKNSQIIIQLTLQMRSQEELKRIQQRLLQIDAIVTARR